MEYIGVVTGGTYTDGNKDCFSCTLWSAENAYNKIRNNDYLEDVLNEYLGKNVTISIVESGIYAFYHKHINDLVDRFTWAEKEDKYSHILKGVVSFKREYYRTQNEKDFDYVNCYIGDINLSEFIIDHKKSVDNQNQFLRLRIESY